MLNPCRSCCVFLSLSLVRLFAASSAPAQSTVQSASKTVVLSGTVADPSGAIIPDANVHVETSSLRRDIKTDSAGRFSASLPAGTYDVTVVAPGFSPYIATVKLTGASVNVSAKLAIATDSEVVSVAASDTSSTAAADNKSALTFSGADLKTFSSDDSTFQQQIEALAGSGGDTQSGPQVYVNGFSNGRFPPKNSIREIRINQNPYSAQYDQLGYGRIEILTKPGTDAIHGFFSIEGNDNELNTTNPYAISEPPYHTLNFEGNVSGPIGKKTSFFVSGVTSDMRALKAAAVENPKAQLAIAMFAYQLRKAIAGMISVLGGFDGLVFTGGIGENDPSLRAAICVGLECMGVNLDLTRNQTTSNPISLLKSANAIQVIPSEENAQIARHTKALAP